jgi:uroporphyrin-III C-methyltransferase
MQTLSNGKVTLVGAGPGDPDLFTIKGLKALQKAEVILYDALINPKLLNHNRTAKKIFVGKRRGFTKETQVEINKLIVEYALKGFNVVRLKGGDPLVFGRACEELEVARSFKIQTAIVPGISSYSGIAAQHQIPLTKRAAHESFSSATVVVLMGMRFLPGIVDTFRQHKGGDYPVAVIQNGTTPAEKSLVADLDSLVDLVNTFNIDNPAALIFGSAVIDPVTDFKNLVNKEVISI